MFNLNTKVKNFNHFQNIITDLENKYEEKTKKYNDFDSLKEVTQEDFNYMNLKGLKSCDDNIVNVHAMVST